MIAYTLQIGDGDGQTINALVASEMLGATDLLEAIAIAKVRVKARAERADENTVRLLQETDDGGSVVMWVRPVSAL